MIRPPAPRKEAAIWFAIAIVLGFGAGAAALAVTTVNDYRLHGQSVNGMTALSLIVSSYLLRNVRVYARATSLSQRIPISSPGSAERLMELSGVLVCYLLFPCFASVAGAGAWFWSRDSWLALAIGLCVGAPLTWILQASVFARELSVGRQL